MLFVCVDCVLLACVRVLLLLLVVYFVDCVSRLFCVAFVLLFCWFLVC